MNFHICLRCVPGLWGAERSSPRPEAEITAEIPVHSPAVWKCCWKDHIKWASGKVHKPFQNRNLYLYLFLLFWIPAHHLALNASSVGGHQSHVKPLIWSQQDQVDFLLLRGLSHGKRIQKWSVYLENKWIIFNVGTPGIESSRLCAYLMQLQWCRNSLHSCLKETELNWTSEITPIIIQSLGRLSRLFGPFYKSLMVSTDFWGTLRINEGVRNAELPGILPFNSHHHLSRGGKTSSAAFPAAQPPELKT